MGIYLNPNNENFRRTLSAPVYVDKTMMISVTNRFIDTGNNYICMSRPRRFGKTIAGNMLSAYYSKGCDSSELFKDYKISSDPGYEEKRNKYNVIKIDMNSEYQNTKDRERLIDILSGKVITEICNDYPDIKVSPDENTIAEAIMEVYSKTNETFIIIIDEYDVLVREQVSKDLFERYLSFLNGLFKSDTLRPAISLAYLTGILPIVRDKIQSKLNNFKEYTILNSRDFAEFVGFTADEVKDLCRKYNVDYENCRHWYDGYRQDGLEIYNPESVIMCLHDGEFENYWSKTSSYQAISDRICENYKGTKDDVIKMLSGESVDVDAGMYLNTVGDFSTKDEVFTYLIHLGYLVYDRKEKTCRIPNKEVRDEWARAVSKISEYEVTDEIIKASKELLRETVAGNEEAVSRALDKSHIHVSSNRSYNNEDVLQSAIYLAFIYALNDYECFREVTAGKGFADLVYIPIRSEKPALIIELKRNKTVDSALDQIKDKKYFECLNHFSGNMIFVGINYDEEKKTHECRIERFVKE